MSSHLKSAPMAQIKPSGARIQKKFSASLLPCRVRHSGAISAPRRLWNPSSHSSSSSSSSSGGGSGGDGLENDEQTAYFRGRKLKGRRMSLPRGYRGVLVRKTDRTTQDTTLRDQALADLESRRPDMDADEYAEELEDLRAASRTGDLTADVAELETVGGFDEVTVWGHEGAPTGSAVEGGGDDNPYARALLELVALSHAIHRR